MIKQEDSFQKSQADTEEVSVTEEVKESNNEGEKNFSESDVIILEEDDKIVENFQPNELYYQIKIMKALEKDADYKLKSLKENDLVNRKLSIEKYIKALNWIFFQEKADHWAAGTREEVPWQPVQQGWYSGNCLQ